MRRLLGRRTVRQSDAAFVVEGATLLRTAVDAGAEVESVYLAPAADPAAHAAADAAARRGARVFDLAPGVLERVADTVTPQPVLAVVRQPRPPAGVLDHATFVVVCAGVRDPGNAGTVIRSAAAAGADAVACSAGTVDPFNPKTVRASAGAVLLVPVVAAADPGELLDHLGRVGLRRVGAVAAGGRPHTAIDWTVPVAIVLGNEAAGLGTEVTDRLDDRVTIPMAGTVESLNVSMAATVLCFEVARQRSNSLGTMQASGTPGTTR